MREVAVETPSSGGQHEQQQQQQQQQAQQLELSLSLCDGKGGDLRILSSPNSTGAVDDTRMQEVEQEDRQYHNDETSEREYADLRDQQESSTPEFHDGDDIVLAPQEENANNEMNVSASLLYQQRRIHELETELASWKQAALTSQDLCHRTNQSYKAMVGTERAAARATRDMQEQRQDQLQQQRDCALRENDKIKVAWKRTCQQLQEVQSRNRRNKAKFLQLSQAAAQISMQSSANLESMAEQQRVLEAEQMARQEELQQNHAELLERTTTSYHSMLTTERARADANESALHSSLVSLQGQLHEAKLGVHDQDRMQWGKLQEIQYQLDQACIENDRLQQEMALQQDMYIQQTAELEHVLQTEKANLGEQLVSVLQSMDELVEVNTDLREQLEDHGRQESDLEQALSRERQRADEEVAQLSTELETVSTHCDTLQVELAATKGDCVMLELSVVETQAANDDLRHQVKILEAELSKAMDRSNDLEAQRKSVEDENRSLHEEVSKGRTRVDHLEAELATSKQSCTSLEQDVSKKNATIQELCDQVATVEAALSRTTERAGNLEAHVKTVEDKNSTLQQAVAEGQAGMEKLSRDVKEMVNEIDAMASKSEALESELSTAHAQNATLACDLMTNNDLVAHHKTYSTFLEDQVTSLHEEKESLKKELSDSQQKGLKLRTELDASGEEVTKLLKEIESLRDDFDLQRKQLVNSFHNAELQMKQDFDKTMEMERSNASAKRASLEKKLMELANKFETLGDELHKSKSGLEVSRNHLAESHASNMALRTENAEIHRKLNDKLEQVNSLTSIRDMDEKEIKCLRDLNTKLLADVSGLRTQTSTQQAENETLSSEIDSIQSELQEQKLRNDIVTEEFGVVFEEKSQLEQQVAWMLQSMDDLLVVNTDLKEELEERGNTELELENIMDIEKRRSKGNISILTTELSAMRSRYAALEREHISIKETNSTLLQSVHKMDSENEEIRCITKHIEELLLNETSRSKTLKASLDKLDATHACVVAEATTTKEESERTRKALHAQLLEMGDRVKRLEGKNDELRLEMALRKLEMKDQLDDAKNLALESSQIELSVERALSKVSRGILESKVFELESDIASKCHTIEQNQCEIENLRHQLVSESELTSSLSSEISEIRHELSSKAAECDSLLATNSELSSRMEMQSKQCDGLEQELDIERRGSRASVATLSTQLAERKAFSDALEANLASIRESHFKLSESNHEMDVTIIDLKSMNRSLLEELRQSNDFATRTSDDLRELDSMHKKLVLESSEIKATNADLAAANSNLENSLLGCQCQLEAMEEALKNLTLLHESLEIDTRAKDAQILKLTEVEGSLRDELDEVRWSEASLMTKVEEQLDEISCLQQSRHALAAAVFTMEGDIERLEHQLELESRTRKSRTTILATQNAEYCLRLTMKENDVWMREEALHREHEELRIMLLSSRRMGQLSSQASRNDGVLPDSFGDGLIVLREELHAACSENHDLQNHITVLQCRIKELEESKKRHRGAESKLVNRIAEMKKSLSTLAEVLEEVTETNDALSFRITDLEEELASTKRAKLKLLAQVKSNDLKMQSATAVHLREIQEQTNQNKKLENEISVLNELMAQAVTKARSVQAAEFAVEQQELQTKYDESRDAIEGVRKALEDAENRENVLATKLDLLQSELQLLQSTTQETEESLQKEVAKYKSELSDESFANSFLKNAIGKLNQTNDALETKCSDLEERVKEFQLYFGKLQEMVLPEKQYDTATSSQQDGCTLIHSNSSQQEECDFTENLSELHNVIHQMVRQQRGLSVREDDLAKQVQTLQAANTKLGQELRVQETRAIQKLQDSMSRSKWLDEQLVASQRVIANLEKKRSELIHAHAKSEDEANARASSLAREVVMLQLEVASARQKLGGTTATGGIHATVDNNNREHRHDPLSLSATSIVRSSMKKASRAGASSSSQRNKATVSFEN